MPDTKQTVAVLTDSNCDLPQEYFKKYPIFRLPLGISCGETLYRDGVDITVEDVYARQKNTDFKTSLPRVEDIDAVLDAIQNAGYRQIIALPLAEVLSGTANLLRLAAAERDGLEMAVYDTKSSSVGVGILALQTAQYAARGVPFHVLTKLTEQLIADTYVFFSLDTLEYLQRGGRIGRVTAIAGALLNIKPILSFAKEDGVIYTPGKVRGRKAVEPWLVEHLVTMLAKEEKAAGARLRYNLVVCDGGVPQEGAALEAAVKKALPDHENLLHGQLDATLAVHLGPRLLGAGIQFLRSGLPG